MYKVLVIEDEAINQLILKQTLEKQGYEVAVASDGETGLAMVEAFEPALIICDWMMPKMSGVAVCQSLKANPTSTNIFFILLTARTEIQDRIEGLDSGADDFLNKPIQPSELLARVRAGLRIYQSAQDLRVVRDKLQAQQQRLSVELTQAANYVTSLLPKSLSGKVNISSQFLPSAQLGGDCFDFYWLDDDHLVVYVLDVSGHGLGAALPSVSMQQVMRSQSLPSTNFYDPSSVMRGLNQIFQMSAHNPRFFTLWYGVYRQSDQTLTYASAGHPPALLVTPGGNMQHIGQSGQLPIGMFTNSTYQCDQCTIEPGSVLYSFSDGLYEIQLNEQECWDHDGLSEMIQKLHQAGSVSLPEVLETIHQTQNIEAFEDDCSIVQLRF
ncbi:MAG: SpoIIE family protein phosphatase [Cyanobacteria bacterium J06648_10]